MSSLVLLHLLSCVVTALPPLPSTFGSGLASVSVCLDVDTLVLNHTVTPGNFGVASHYWSTGPDNILISYFVDAEANASVAFQPPLAAGQGFPTWTSGDPLSPGGLFTAGGRTGKAGAVGGWYVDWAIPFYSSLRVTARLLPAAGAGAALGRGSCAGAYLIVRGYEEVVVSEGAAPILTLPSGFPLPNGTRLQLQALNAVTLPPLWPVSLANVSFGFAGLLLANFLALSTSPPGNNYIEGCWHLTPTGNATWPGGSVVLGTGFEDFYNSAFWFGAASGFPSGLLFTHPSSGLTHFSRGPPQGAPGVEQLSAYRYFHGERVGWQDGGRLTWRVGDTAGKCRSGGTEGPIGSPSSVTLTSYTWLYVWPNGQPIAPLPPPPPPAYMSYTCDGGSGKCVPLPNSSGTFWESDCGGACGAPPGPPAIVGCGDGTCETFCALPNLRGCAVAWEGAADLRTPPSSGGGAGCGGATLCPLPSDACGPGWGVCASNATSPGLSLDGFRAAVDADVCGGGSAGRYAAAVSHADAAWEPLPPGPCPASSTDADNGCRGDGWGSEPVCCGRGCAVPSCPSYVWVGATRIHTGVGEGCASVTSDWLDGVLCCREGA